MQESMFGVQKTMRFASGVVYKHKVMQQNKQRFGYGLLTVPLQNGITVLMEVITQNNVSSTQVYKCDYNTNIDVVNTHKYTPTIKTISTIVSQVHMLTDNSNITPYAYQHQHIVCSECYNSKCEKCYCTDCFACCRFTYYTDINDVQTTEQHIEQHRKEHDYCSYCNDCVKCCIGYCYE